MRLRRFDDVLGLPVGIPCITSGLKRPIVPSPFSPDAHHFGTIRHPPPHFPPPVVELVPSRARLPTLQFQLATNHTFGIIPCPFIDQRDLFSYHYPSERPT